MSFRLAIAAWPASGPTSHGVAVLTIQGTGSETTGTAILDIPSKSFKTGIASRALKPTLGIVDLNNTATCPREVAISAGLDVLFHSLESEHLALPFVLARSTHTGVQVVGEQRRAG